MTSHTTRILSSARAVAKFAMVAATVTACGLAKVTSNKSGGEEPATTTDLPPVPGAFLATSDVTPSGFKLSWLPAEDDRTPVDQLLYKICTGATPADIDTVEKCEAAVEIVPYSKNLLTVTVSGLAADSQHHYNAVVSDEAGNKTVYAAMTQATAADGKTPSEEDPILKVGATITGAPTGSSSTTTLDVTIGGTDITEYRYDMVSGTSCVPASYSAWTKVATHITEATGADGTKTLCVLGRNKELKEQPTPTSASWIKDTSDPAVILSGAPIGSSSATTLDVIVAGAGIIEYRYDLVSGSDCATGTYGTWTPVATHITESIGADGAKILCVFGRDKALNWQPNPTTASWTKDTVAPTATLSGAPNDPSNAAALNVTVGGVGVAEYQYDLVSGADCTGPSYGGWTPVATHITEGTGASGNKILCVKGRDAAHNEQTVATTATWLKDATPPAAGAFSASTAVTGSGFTLQWTAGSDAMTAVGALEYFVCSATDAASIDTVSECLAATTEMTWAAGTLTHTVSGKWPLTTYYLNVIVRDAAQNAAIYGGKTEATTIDETKLTASDGAGSDNLGISAAVSGTTVVLGAYGASGGQGAAYVYRFDPSDSSWLETKLTASDGAGSDTFGVSAAVSGNTVVIGAYGSNLYQGAAYVYRFDPSDNSWQETKLTASDGVANDEFGLSAAVSGNTVVIGAYNANVGQGAAYVYRFDPSDNSWQETKLTASDGASGDSFGVSAAISDNTVVIGANAVGSSQGAAYVYRFDPSINLWQETKLTASDGAGNDDFGISAAVSGNTVVIGAYGSDSNQGAAYVYRFDPSDNLWQEAKLNASDGASNDYFGYSAAVSGNTLVLGAHNTNAGKGAAYVYRFDPSDSAWQEVKLTASNGTPSDYFGYSVAVSGNTVFIGAYGEDSFKGAAHVYEFEVVEPDGETKLTASDGAGGDYFGGSAAVSGDNVVIGAYGSAGSYQGAAYVYRFDPSDNLWQETKLTASDGAGGDYFGVSAAVSGNTIVLGAYGVNSTQGAAYVYRFDPSDNLWQETKLTASDGAGSDYFGYSAAVSDNTIVLGAHGANTGQGAAYVYRFDPSNNLWQETKLTASDGAGSDQFGISAAVSGNSVVIGAQGAGSYQGAAYVYRFDPSDNLWQETKLTASDGAAGNTFGYSAAVSGNTVVVGARDAGSTQGAAYVYRFDPSDNLWQETKLTASDGAGGDYFGVSATVSGNTVVLGAHGVGSAKGAAYVYRFDPSDNLWQETKLTASDGAAGNTFGVSAAVSGNTVVLGAHGVGSGQGAAYVYKVPE